MKDDEFFDDNTPVKIIKSFFRKIKNIAKRIFKKEEEPLSKRTIEIREKLKKLGLL